MELEITTIFCLCDELLTAIGNREAPQIRMPNAEVMTVALTAASFFHGPIERARIFLKEHGYIPTMLSESRLNRRIHALPDYFWRALFQVLAETFKATASEQEYCVDSFPVPVCDNIRIRRCRLYHGEDYRGYIASKRRYFYGLRVHLIVTTSGQPVALVLRPGEQVNVTVYKDVNFDLPQGAHWYGDKMYNDYAHEDLLRDAIQIDIHPLRKKNSTRKTSSLDERDNQVMRKRIETSFSQITACFPKTIHAVTPRGFELKIVLFILAFGIQWIL